MSFLKDAVAAHDHFQDSVGRRWPEICQRWRAGTPGAKQRPAFGNAIPRDCLPKQGVPRKTPRPVFENKALHKLLTENKSHLSEEGRTGSRSIRKGPSIMTMKTTLKGGGGRGKRSIGLRSRSVL